MHKPLERILYAEDDPEIRNVAVLALEMVGGFTVKVCHSGQEVLDTIEPFQPDLLLLDVVMPGMDGLAVLQAIQRITDMDTVPAIFMTAQHTPQDIARYKALGAIDVIAKPFAPMTLADTVRTLWARHI